MAKFEAGRDMSGSTTGSVRVVLRLEGLCALVAALLGYSKMGQGWGAFALCFLAPDISLIGYLAGSTVGAITYNVAHSYVGAIACLAIGALVVSPALSCAGLIWCAHIGFDRALGYGLKYSAGFSFTHLGHPGHHPVIAAMAADDRWP